MRRMKIIKSRYIQRLWNQYNLGYVRSEQTQYYEYQLNMFNVHCTVQTIPHG